MQERPRSAVIAASSDVDRFAVQLLSVTASDVRQSGAPKLRRPFEIYIARLHDAVLNSNRQASLAVLAEMRAAQIDDASIAECYVPAVARRLGEGWVADTLNFGAVSVGSARLQSLLRQLHDDWRDVYAAPTTDRSTLLIITPPDCDHTLGACVLAGHIRRRGHPVQLELGPSAAKISEWLTHRKFAGVMVSASAGTSLDTLRDLVQAAHVAAPTIPILIGGTLLQDMENIEAITGADHATCDIDSALTFCGISTSIATSRRDMLRQQAG